MTNESVRAESSCVDRLGTVPNWAVVVAVIVAAFVGIHGTTHVLFAPSGHLQVSTQGILLALWGLTTFVALGGLAALGGAYASLGGYPDTSAKVDIEILPEAERRILKPVLETPGITQGEIVARSGFSDAKVSQILKALRERGLMYREPQRRTYRLYPGTVLV